jgi:hypothetical protein
MTTRVRSRIALSISAAAAVLAAAGPAGADTPIGIGGEDPKAIEWLFIKPGFGYQRVWLRTFRAEDSERLTAHVIPEDLSGPAPSLGLGVKLWFVTVGVTGRVAHLSGAAPERESTDLDLWSVDGELAFRAPLGPLEPYVLVGAGYSTFGGMGDVVDGMGSGLDVNGVNLRGGLGFDYYLTREVSLRLEGSSDILFLARPGVAARDLAEPKKIGTLDEAEQRMLEADGSSAGLAFGVTVGLGFHF